MLKRMSTYLFECSWPLFENPLCFSCWVPSIPHIVVSWDERINTYTQRSFRWIRGSVRVVLGNLHVPETLLGACKILSIFRMIVICSLFLLILSDTSLGEWVFSKQPMLDDKVL